MQSLSVRDPHSYGNTQDVIPAHLSLDVNLDFERQIMDGICELKLTWVQSTANYIDLDTRDLTIQTITDAAGQSLRYELGPLHPFMGSRLRILTPEQHDTIRITYRTHPAAGALQWLSPAQTTSHKLPFLFTQSQAILARTWFPCMDSPGVRVTYDAVVRVPRGMRAVMSAYPLEHDAPNGVFSFTMPLAIPTYLIALAAGELAFEAMSNRTGIFAEPEVLNKATWECADMEQMVLAAESLYGPYRWGRWDAIILPPSFPYGGMENPMLTFATPTILAGDRSLVSLMAHELAHSWSGNLVTNATWGDFWLNEGCTTYFERRIVEALYGRDTANMQWLLGQRALHHTVERFMTTEPEFTKLRMNLTNRNPDDAFSELPYEKGANFLRVLESHVGRRTLDSFLLNYFDTYAFQSMTTTQFLELLQDQLFHGDTTAWGSLQINTWVNNPGLPDNMVTPTLDHFDRTRAAANAFMTAGSLTGVQSDNWVTAEWLDFLKSLPDAVPADKLRQLDQAFNLTQYGNSEILFAWLRICVRNTYEPAFATVKSFLCTQGRRKFLAPLYQALWDNPQTQALATTIYRNARPGYHPIAVSTIDGIINREEA